MERADLWYFSKERLERTPSRENGIEAEKELSLRQQAANFIQDIGQCLAVSQLCINTAIVYMHRFYMFHSFTKFHRFKIAACAMFLAAKVEEQPRKMEHVLKISHICLHKNDPPLDVTSPAYLEKQAELVSNENIMLQTLGFVIGIDHPHTYIVKLCQLVKASKDLAQTSYFMATNSLHLTTMCLQYKPTVVACVCIHLACKWADWKIAPCSEGKEWYYYVDKTVTLELLEELTNEFVKILKEYPNKIRRKVSFANGKEPSSADRRKLEQTIGCIERAIEQRPEQSSDTNQPKKRSSPESSSLGYLDLKDDFPSTSGMLNCTEFGSAENSPSKKLIKSETSSSVSITLADYREKRDKGRLEKKNAHLEIPSSSQRQNAAVDKHSRPLINHEKPQHPMPYTKPEFTMQRVVEKSNKLSSEFNPSSVDKFNHQTSRLPTVNESHHQENKFIAPVKNAPEIKTEPQGNKVDHPSRDANKDILPHPDSTESFSSNIVPAPLRPSDVEQNVTIRLPHEKRTHNLGPERTNQKLPDISLHNKVNKVKHPKHKPASQSPPRNSHGELLPTSQDNSVLKQSSDWDSAKSSCSSSKREPCVVIEHKAVAAATAAAAEQIRVPEKTPEPPVKHERKEKHKHKHSVHSSSKEKSSRNREPPPPDQNISGGLKITIPKDKIVLSGVRPDSSQKSNLVKPEDKRCLKIKLPKPKIACSDAPQPPIGLKLVLTKDKNAGSYSASHKPDKVSRKREHSPKDHSSKNSESGKPSKVAKLEESQKSFHQEVYHAPALPPEQKISRHFHHGEANQFVSAGSKKNPGRGYHHLNDSSVAPSQYVMPYGSSGQQYYQQYSQPQTNISGSGYQNKMVHVSYDHTKLPPPPPDVPPLPKDPPPPLPPQPPPEY